MIPPQNPPRDQPPLPAIALAATPKLAKQLRRLAVTQPQATPATQHPILTHDRPVTLNQRAHRRGLTRQLTAAQPVDPSLGQPRITQLLLTRQQPEQLVNTLPADPAFCVCAARPVPAVARRTGQSLESLATHRRTQPAPAQHRWITPRARADQKVLDPCGARALPLLQPDTLHPPVIQTKPLLTARATIRIALQPRIKQPSLIPMTACHAQRLAAADTPALLRQPQRPL